MPILFLILLPFILASFVLRERAYRRLTPEQKQEVDSRSASPPGQFLIWIFLMFIGTSAFEMFVPESAKTWILLGLFGLCLIFKFSSKPLPSNSQCEVIQDETGIPASFDQQVMVSYWVQQIGLVVFAVGLLILMFFTRK